MFAKKAKKGVFVQVVLRREEKYPLTLGEAYQYAEKFQPLLTADPASADGNYKVRSLYFDTLGDDDFFDKIREQNIRRKIRLRIYHPGDRTAKLEMKQKENIYQKKRSLSVSREDAIKLIRGDYTVLLSYEEPFAKELFCMMNEECYRPKSIVEYDRRAFMAPVNNIRLTFDSNIRATESSVDLFDPNLILYPVYPEDRVVFEVKYNRFLLDYLQQILESIDRREVSSSKYCLGRSIGYPLFV